MMLLLNAITLFFPNITDLVSIFLLFGGVMAVFIVIRVYEALLLSHAQITRAMKLYEHFQFNDTSYSGLDSFVENLNSANEMIGIKNQ